MRSNLSACISLANRLTGLFAALGLVACASAVTSPYFQPEPGVVFRYGKFCGPGQPALLADATLSREQRLVGLSGMRPLDDIDRACQFHDLCYELHSEEQRGPCDRGFDLMLSWSFNLYGERREVAQCGNLIAEIQVGIGLVKSGPFTRTLDVASMPIAAPITAANRALDGYPAAPGQCLVKARDGSLAKDPLAVALKCYFSEPHVIRDGCYAEGDLRDDWLWLISLWLEKDEGLTEAGRVLRDHVRAVEPPCSARPSGADDTVCAITSVH